MKIKSLTQKPSLNLAHHPFSGWFWAKKKNSVSDLSLSAQLCTCFNPQWPSLVSNSYHQSSFHPYFFSPKGFTQKNRQTKNWDVMVPKLPPLIHFFPPTWWEFPKIIIKKQYILWICYSPWQRWCFFGRIPLAISICFFDFCIVEFSWMNTHSNMNFRAANIIPYFLSFMSDHLPKEKKKKPYHGKPLLCFTSPGAKKRCGTIPKSQRWLNLSWLSDAFQ